MSKPFALVAALMLCAGTAAAEGVGRVTLSEGQVTRAAGSAAASPLKEGDPIATGDHLATGADGRLEVLFEDGSVMRLGKSSQLDVTELSFDEPSNTLKAKLHLALGKLWSHVEKLGHDGDYEVSTDRAVAGVRGTEFRVDAAGEQGAIEVYEGRVAISDKLALNYQPGKAAQMPAVAQNWPPPSSAAGGAVATAPQPSPAKQEPPKPSRAEAPANHRSITPFADEAHSDAEMKRAISGENAERILDANQRVEFAAAGFRDAPPRTADEFDAFARRPRPTRDAVKKAFHRDEKREKPAEKRHRRHERLERQRWRR